MTGTRPRAPERVLPERVPGLNALAAGLSSGAPDVARFLPDPPTLAAVSARATHVRERFRLAPRPGAAPEHADLADGRAVAVVAGQQVGALTGPLLTLVKAAAAIGLARDLSRDVPAAPLFWCAGEDHDLVEVSRLPLPSPGGPRDAGPDAGPLLGNRKPVGALPVGVDLEFAAQLLGEGAGAPECPLDVETLLALSRGRSYHEAFVASMRWLLPDPQLRFTDAARREDKPALVPLAVRLVRERQAVRRLLEERAEALVAAGHRLQVTTEPRALPLFAILGGERLLLREEGGRLALKGGPEGETFDPEEVVARFESGEWLPSFSALTRPLAASVLFPVAAAILGPAEIAYWAQSHPLFGWAGILPPVLLPRPMAAFVDPTSASLLDRSGLTLEALLQGREEVLRSHGSGRAGGILSALERLRADNARELDALREPLLEVDPTLARPLQATRQNLDFALSKLLEKASAAAGRADETFARQVDRLLLSLLPGGQLAERVYGPLPYLARYGREGLVGALLSQLDWSLPGVQEVRL
ncbi:MAG: bacillithiol biosynthesis BshC [Acidobacteria bacterium]|nr:MAG: bacillithiol biosynthesis BshC [Acidobacteriota bacterium]